MKLEPSVKDITKIKSIEATDKATLLFITEEPYVVFPATLEYPSLGIVSPSSTTFIALLFLYKRNRLVLNQNVQLCSPG